MNRPASLRPHDLVVMLSPASSPKKTAFIRQGIASLQRLKLNVSCGRCMQKQTGYLAGTDSQRAHDLKQAFLNPRIKGIFCSRGGYGSSRVLEHLQIRHLVMQPKVFIGFSDITLIHLAMQKAGLTSFWGPMPATAAGLTSFSAKWLKRAVMSREPIGPLPPGKETLRTGIVEGRLTGGTLSLLAASLGTSYECQTRNRIVFLEDVGEEPYRIDRMLTQLLAAGKLADAGGIALGVFQACEPVSRIMRPSFSLREVLYDRLRPLGLPVFCGLPIGHIANQVTLPYGVRARLNAKKRELTILEAGVK